MKKNSTFFLRTIIVLIASITLFLLIKLPLSEGRAANLDLFSIYADSFIIYGYASSIAFFIALYQAFKLLGYIGQNKVFSLNSVKALKTIKYCAIILSLLIIAGGIYVRLFHEPYDDPAGFLALSILTSFIAIVVATVASVFEKTLQVAVDIKSENDLTV